jgi:hypothetical protein
MRGAGHDLNLALALRQRGAGGLVELQDLLVEASYDQQGGCAHALQGGLAGKIRSPTAGYDRGNRTRQCRRDAQGGSCAGARAEQTQLPP